MKDAEGNLTLQLDTDNTRRGSRGSILSGKANVDPEPAAMTIPAYHLAKLSLAANRNYVFFLFLNFYFDRTIKDLIF